MTSPTRSSLLLLLYLLEDDEGSVEEEETAMWMHIILSHSETAASQSCLFLLLLIRFNNSLRFRSKLKRPALLSPGLSPWSRLLASGDESSFLNVTGLTYGAFNELLGALYDPAPEVGVKRGRPSSPVPCVHRIHRIVEVSLPDIWRGSFGGL